MKDNLFLVLDFSREKKSTSNISFRNKEWSDKEEIFTCKSGRGDVDETFTDYNESKLTPV